MADTDFSNQEELMAYLEVIGEISTLSNNPAMILVRLGTNVVNIREDVYTLMIGEELLRLAWNDRTEIETVDYLFKRNCFLMYVRRMVVGWHFISIRRLRHYWRSARAIENAPDNIRSFPREQVQALVDDIYYIGHRRERVAQAQAQGQTPPVEAVLPSPPAQLQTRP